jgi:hypothetical protein
MYLKKGEETRARTMPLTAKLQKWYKLAQKKILPFFGRTFLQEVILEILGISTIFTINYFLAAESTVAAEESTFTAVVSTVTAGVSTVTAGESALTSLFSPLLQAVIKPATAKIANTFFM